jgi:hypothetical protein
MDEAEKELVIIVPFIKTSKLLYECLLNANQRNVETTIVYRENKLPQAERAKLIALSNLNLLHHPNVHAKCYMNEKYIIITSMNLYEYSEKNNREMGIVLFENKKSISIGISEEGQPMEEARNEIKSIINSATIEKKSSDTIHNGFELDIIKTKWDKADEYCRILNKVFVNKRFKVENLHNEPICKCEDYYDKIDLYLDYRIELVLKMGDDAVQRIYDRFKPSYNEFRFKYFKFYWNHPRQPLFLYFDSKYNVWSKAKDNNQLELIHHGIDDLIKFIRSFF